VTYARWGRDRPSSTRLIKGQLLRQRIYKRYDYAVVTLPRPGAGPHPYYVHRLVLEAFAGLCPAGQEAPHGPDGSLDNRRPENLEWGTKDKNNGPDKVRDGTLACGERNGQARLTADAVREIRQRYAVGGIS
jgi:hypothetical protein